MKKIISIFLVLITILSVFTLASCSKKDGDITVPSGYSLARSDVNGFYFFYPSTVWLNQGSEDGENAYISVVKAAYKDSDSSNVVANKWTENYKIGNDDDCILSPEEYWNGIGNDNTKVSVRDNYNGYVDTLQGFVKDYKSIAEETTEIAGCPAFKVVYSGNIAGVLFKIMQVSIFKNSAGGCEVYEFTYTSTPENYDGNLDAVNKMLETFVIE